MKITKRQLRRIIQEELNRTLNEDRAQRKGQREYSREVSDLEKALKANQRQADACDEVFEAFRAAERGEGTAAAWRRAYRRCDPEGRHAKRAHRLFDKAMEDRD